MKKSITLFLGLLLMGAGVKSYGQAAGDYVFTQPASTDSTWVTLGNWSVSDGAGGFTAATRLPIATDNVWIPADKKLGTTLPAVTNLVSSITNGSTTVTLSASNANVLPGMAVKNSDNHFGIAPGTYVVSVSGTTVTLSAPAVITNASVKLSFFTACKNLNVNGTFRASTVTAFMGDIIVNNVGLFTLAADIYCRNIFNYGKIIGNTSFRSSQKNLYLGFNGAVPATGDFQIVNDGIFGDTQPRAVAANGSGIKIQYSNQANNVSIKTSQASVTGYAFNIAQLVPISGIKTTKNTVLNIKQNMSLLLHNGISLSVQQNDSCEGTTRVCNIDPGVTVYLGYNFHANRNVTTVPQGNFVYNIYGTLDLGAYATSANNTTGSATNTTALSLCMSNVAGNSGTLTVNVGDGTQANGGTLVVGSLVQMYKQTTQTIKLNFNDYSTVKFTGNYGWQAYYQLLNNSMPALYLFPTKFYNLTIDGAGIILPVKPKVKGTYTYASGKYGSANSNWTAATSSRSFGGTLYAVQGNVINTGSAYYYVPVINAKGSWIGSTATPAFTSTSITMVNDTAMQYMKSGLVINGNGIANDTIVSVAGNVVTIKNGVSQTVTTVTNGALTIKGLQGTVAPTGTSTNPYAPVFDGCQGLIYLGASEFEGYTSLTDVNSPNANSVLVYSAENNKLVIAKATVGDIATVFSISGVKVATVKLTSDNTTLSIARGIYLVKVNNSVSKVVVK